MAEIKRKVKFLRDYEVKDHRAGTAEAEAYKAGKTVSLSEASARHFIIRGAAEPADKGD